MSTQIYSISDESNDYLRRGQMQVGFPWWKVIEWHSGIMRVTRIDGGIIYLTTPHGSVWKTGFVDFMKHASKVSEDKRKLAADYIRDARAKGIKSWVRLGYRPIIK